MVFQRKHRRRRLSKHCFLALYRCGIAVVVLFLITLLFAEYALVGNSPKEHSVTDLSQHIRDIQQNRDTSSRKESEQLLVKAVGNQPMSLHETAQDGSLLLSSSEIIKKQSEPYSRSHDSSTTLNTIPVAWQSGPPPTAKVHCVGIQNQVAGNDDDWMIRSCYYTNLCVDTESDEYVLVLDDEEQLESTIQEVSIGVINPRWNVGRGFDRGLFKVKWKPTRKHPSDYNSYYQLPASTTLVPFHSMAGHNVGHLLWDDFYAIFKLLRIFDIILDDMSLLLVRHQINQTLYANCDIRRNKRLQCRANMERFLPLLGVDPHTFSTTKQLNLVKSLKLSSIQQQQQASTTLVCASQAVAGLGLLQDHGWRDHGWDLAPSATALTVPHNMGWGRSFFDFSQFLRRNYNEANQKHIIQSYPSRPLQITFSLRSSRDWIRRQNFTTQIQALHTIWRGDNSNNNNNNNNLVNTNDFVVIKAYAMHELSLLEQIKVAQSTSIFVTTCGGGAMTASFLPRHASLVVYYDARGGLDFATLSSNNETARLDWDLLNHAGALRVHWLPLHTMENDLDLFVKLIQHEVATLHRMHVEEDEP